MKNKSELVESRGVTEESVSSWEKIDTLEENRWQVIYDRVLAKGFSPKTACRIANDRTLGRR